MFTVSSYFAPDLIAAYAYQEWAGSTFGLKNSPPEQHQTFQIFTFRKIHRHRAYEFAVFLAVDWNSLFLKPIFHEGFSVICDPRQPHQCSVIFLACCQQARNIDTLVKSVEIN